MCILCLVSVSVSVSFTQSHSRTYNHTFIHTQRSLTHRSKRKTCALKQEAIAHLSTLLITRHTVGSFTFCMERKTEIFLLLKLFQRLRKYLKNLCQHFRNKKLHTPSPSTLRGHTLPSETRQSEFQFFAWFPSRSGLWS